MNLPLSRVFAHLSNSSRLAMVDAIEACFDASDWGRLAIELDMPQISHPESRLQKSLRFGDDDYGYQVAQFVTYLDNENPGAIRSLASKPALKNWLVTNAHSAAAELGLGQQQVTAAPLPPTASEVVTRSLDDAHHLIEKNGAISAVDRLHTALHGYLRDICAKQNLQVPPAATVGMLLKKIRTDHPALVALGPHHSDVDAVLASLAGAVNALGTLRNNASLAHPNQVLLGDAEAMLMFNLVRTIFNYLETRL